MLPESFVFKYVFNVYLSITIQTDFGVCISYTTFHYTGFSLKTMFWGLTGTVSSQSKRPLVQIIITCLSNFDE